MNENRKLMSMDGITGMLVATVVLVVVVLTLAYFATMSQISNSTNYYKIDNEKSIKMFDSQSREKHLVDVKLGE